MTLSYRFVVLLVVSVALVVGCSGQGAMDPGAGTMKHLPSGGEITPRSNTAETATTLVGPYYELVFLSEDEVRKRIGEPSDVVTMGGSLFWKYPDLGLELQFFDGKTAVIHQTQGRVTEEIAIGDEDEPARALAEDVRSGTNNTLIFTLQHGEVIVTVISVSGKVVRARVGPPTSP